MTTAMPMQSRSSGGGRDPDTPSTSVQRHPVATFLLLALGIGWTALAIPAIAGIPFAPFLLALVYFALLAPALVVTRMADGPGGIRRLLSRVLIWRFSIVRWAVIVLAMPALTLALAAASGTLETPEGGWISMSTTYMFNTFIIGALLLNLWEETAWAGFAQTRLMARHGLLMASLMTALPFAAIHIPLQFEGNWTWSKAAFGAAIVFILAPFYRYLLGMHLLDTRGSILATGIQHASWNEATKLDAVSGDWQTPVAVILLTALVAIGRRMSRPESRPMTLDAQKNAAAQWIGTPAPWGRTKTRV